MKNIPKFDIFVMFVIFGLIYSGNALIGNIFLAAYLGFTIWKNIPMFYAVAGSKAYNRGDMDKAMGLFKKAVENKNTKPNIISSYGYILLRAGRLEEAEPHLIKATEMYESDMKFRYSSILNLAILRWKQGRIDEAIEMVEKIKEEHKNSINYQVLGYLYISKGDYAKALEANQEAYDYNKDDQVIADNLAQTYYFLGRYDEAEAIYNEIIDDVKFPEAFYYFGMIKWKKGEYYKAYRLFAQAQELKTSFLSNLDIDQIAQNMVEFVADMQKKGIDIETFRLRREKELEGEEEVPEAPSEEPSEPEVKEEKKESNREYRS